jgi:hypothetical protein
MLLEWVDFYGLLFLAPFLVLELFWRARRYELARGWRWRAAAVTLGVFGFTFAVGRAWTYYLHPTGCGAVHHLRGDRVLPPARAYR